MPIKLSIGYLWQFLPHRTIIILIRNQPERQSPTASINRVTYVISAICYATLLRTAFLVILLPYPCQLRAAMEAAVK